MISVGIDAAKGKSTVCIMKSYGEVILPPRDIAHTSYAIDQNAHTGSRQKFNKSISRYQFSYHKCKI